jgi:hypothetical protein
MAKHNAKPLIMTERFRGFVLTSRAERPIHLDTSVNHHVRENRKPFKRRSENSNRLV